MLENDDDLGRLEVFRARLRHSLPARFLLRHHLTLVVGASILSGWGVDAFLLHHGMRRMILRYPLAICASYGVFMLGIAAWLRYSGIAEYVTRRKAEELVGEHVPSKPREDFPLSWDWFNVPTVDAEGCLIALLVGIALIAFGGYTIFAAPTFFADVVVEVLLAAGLLRGVRRSRESGWMSGVWANTWGSVVVALVFAAIAAMIAHGMDPPPATLGELWVRLHKH